MFTVQLYVTVTCDECYGTHSHEDVPTLFPADDPDQPVNEELADEGWRIDGDWIVCPACATRGDCIAHGHRMLPSWIPCRCRGVRRGHRAGPDGQECALEFRVCHHCCQHSEYRPITDVAA